SFTVRDARRQRLLGEVSEQGERQNQKVRVFW
uniref:Predicted gene, 26897 n=2 Tax=Mus TaxID=862507 RepID=M0QWX3_MOUSE